MHLRSPIPVVNNFSSADPTHSRAQGNIEYFERLMRSEPEKYANSESEGGQDETPEILEEMSEKERYESLCREAWPIVSPAVTSHMHVHTHICTHTRTHTHTH